MTQAERLRFAIEQSGIKVQKLAEECGVHPNYITMMSGGQRPISKSMADKMARVLKIRKEWLLTGDGQMEADQTYIDQLATLVADLLADDPDSFKVRFISEMAKLPQECWDNVEAFIDHLLEKQKEEE